MATWYNNALNFTLSYICPTNHTLVVLRPSQLSLNLDYQCIGMNVQVCSACQGFHSFLEMSLRRNDCQE